jgi:GDPmannose 4,6-dehydratase
MASCGALPRLTPSVWSRSIHDPHESGVRLHLHYGDLTDGASLRRVLDKSQPDEIYNLAAQSHVRVSFDQAQYTAEVVATGTLRLLEAVRDYSAKVKFYQAGSSEMFGSAKPPQSETTPFEPRSPYAVREGCGTWFARNYREAYGCSSSTGFCSITNRRGGARRSSREKSRARSRASSWACSRSCTWATWIRSATGVTRRFRRGDVVDAATANSRRLCGGDRRETYRARFLNTAGALLDMDWTKYCGIGCALTCAPPKSTCCWATLRRRVVVLGWKPTVNFPGADQDDDRARPGTGAAGVHAGGSWAQSVGTRFFAAMK